MSEHSEQAAFVQWCLYNKKNYPGIDTVHATPNEGKRTKTSAGRLKAAGMRKGFPDISILSAQHGYGSLHLEFKFGKNTVKPEQRDWIIRLRRAGNRAEVVYSCEWAIHVTKLYYQGLLTPYEEADIITPWREAKGQRRFIAEAL